MSHESHLEVTPLMPALLELDQRHIAMIEEVVGGADNVQDIYPLSPLQEGMLFHHLLDEQRDTYMLSTLFELDSAEHIDRLQDALQRVIARHDVLRTAILWRNLPRAVQVVCRRAKLSVEELALDDEHDSLKQITERMRPGNQPMNLQRAPLTRLQVIRDPHRERSYALLQIHHVICDHGSWNLIEEETFACLADHEHELPRPAPYRDYVLSTLARGNSEEAEAFFRSKLGDMEDPTAPFGIVDVRGEGLHMLEARVVLDRELAAQVGVQAQRVGSSPARLFHAAWGIVVAATSGRSDVVFGTVLKEARSKKSAPDRTLGMSINTLPLRLRLREVTARDLLKQTHRELRDLMAHETASLTLAQRCSGIVGSAPLFTALLNYRRRIAAPVAQHGDRNDVRVIGRSEAWTNYPLTLTVDELADGFELIVQTASRIDPQRIAGYVSTAMQELLRALDEAPDTPALMLPILPKAERVRLVEHFNATQAPRKPDKLVSQLFEEQVARTPHALAVVHQQRSLTYTEVSSRANQLARHLIKLGIGPDHLVGICTERGIDMVVGLLGIVKAGAAYLPLDPNYPAERMEYMLRDAAPEVLLTLSELQPLLPPTQVRKILLDAEWSSIAQEPGHDLDASELGLSDQNLIYVIYTSGSTGWPKGTAMPHRAMVNLIEWHRRTLPLAADERVLQFAPLSFDVAFQEVFSTLCDGGTLVLVDEWIRRDAERLVALLSDQRVQRLFLPPLMLQSLAEWFKSTGAAPSSLRDVITAGEQLRVSSEIAALFKHLPECRLHNHYGPTETHVVTTLTLAGDHGEWPELVPIGRPIANVQIYILDPMRRPVALGAAGEIYIGGAGVARGYWKRPEITAQRFVEDLFSGTTAARLYRTGDLGRWTASGTIEFLGRNDDQVKIRGYRIELGEIEARLAEHRDVKEVAVVAHEYAPGIKRLIGYISPRSEVPPSVESLRAHVASALPEYMVPGGFIVLDHLPQTPSGKLDRRALPDPHGGSGETGEEYQPPRGEIEQNLASIWEELLRVPRVSRQDHFLEIGGDSLTAMKLIVQIAERFSISLPAQAVFRHPVLHDMANNVAGLIARAQGVNSPAMADLEEGVL